jgi:nicotinamide-nucleotide amidase
MSLLAKKVITNLRKKKLTISLAESCTGGLISSSITSISGSSKVFTLGLVTYSNKSKISVLKIPKKILKNYGAVSAEVCLHMLKNLNSISKTNISLSTTGIAGPKGSTSKKPVGLVYVGIKIGKKVTIKKFLFKNRGRSYIQKITLNESLKLILQSLK